MAEATNPDWLERANRLALANAQLSATVLEVNNALQVITGSAETLSAASPPEVVSRRAEAIAAHARRASALLAELSSFARDDNTSTNAIDLGQLAQRALAMRQYAMASLRLNSSFESSGPIPPVIANSRAVMQIVLNLLVNAEQALTPGGDGRIVVSVHGDGSMVALSVDDDGPGVAPDRAASLFTQLPSTTRGLGIGLAVSKNLAARFGGTLTYSPRAGGGSRFVINLPVAS